MVLGIMTVTVALAWVKFCGVLIAYCGIVASIHFFWTAPVILDRSGGDLMRDATILTVVQLGSHAAFYALLAAAYPFEGVKRFFSPAPPPPKPARASRVQSLDAYQIRERILERWPWYS